MESKKLPDSLLDPAFSVPLPINGANIHRMAGEIVWCASTCLLELVKTIWQIICTLWTDIISILSFKFGCLQNMFSIVASVSKIITMHPVDTKRYMFFIGSGHLLHFKSILCILVKEMKTFFC